MVKVKGKVFQVNYSEKSAVYSCYMTFLKDGGLFVPTEHALGMNEAVFLMVRLPEKPLPYFLAGQVGWLSFGRKKGMGVRLTPDDHSREFKKTVEQMLSSQIKSQAATYTM